jgi:predicted transcriptional regulator of viral defense system
MKPFIIQEKLKEKNMRLFTVQDFGRLFQEPAYKIKYFLEKQTQQNLLVRLKKGIYALKSDFPQEEEIANFLYQPSYLSFEYALAYYNILPEMPYQITSATTKPTRIFSSNNLDFSYLSIKREAYTGYSLFKTDKCSFMIADKEKALVDYLYYVILGKKTFNERLNLRNIDWRKVTEYGHLFKRKSLDEYVKKIKKDYVNNK